METFGEKSSYVVITVRTLTGLDPVGHVSDKTVISVVKARSDSSLGSEISVQHAVKSVWTVTCYVTGGSAMGLDQCCFRPMTLIDGIYSSLNLDLRCSETYCK